MTAAREIDFASLAEQFLAAQLAGDQREALRLVVEEGIGRGATAIDLHDRVIRAAQRTIGELWQDNRIGIADEHLATGISQVVMARLYEHMKQAASNGALVTVACVEGEQHDLPARFVADYLHHAGFRIRYLGANVPTDDLVTEVRGHRPQLLALSATMTFHLPALRSVVLRLRAETEKVPPILVGGHALTWSPDLPRELGVETAPPTPLALVAVVRRLTGVS